MFSSPVLQPTPSSPMDTTPTQTALLDSIPSPRGLVASTSFLLASKTRQKFVEFLISQSHLSTSHRKTSASCLVQDVVPKPSVSSDISDVVLSPKQTPSASLAHPIESNNSKEVAPSHISIEDALFIDSPKAARLTHASMIAHDDVVQHEVHEDIPSKHQHTNASRKDSGVELIGTSHVKEIPRFYFPYGVPPEKKGFGAALPEGDTQNQMHESLARSFHMREVLRRDEMWDVADALGVPRYASTALFDCVVAHRASEMAGTTSDRVEAGEGFEEEPAVGLRDVRRWWDKLTTTYHDEHAILFAIMQRGRDLKFLSPADFQIVIYEVVQKHPGLEFLANLPVFQARYVETVIVRIFYSKINNCNNGMILPEFRKYGFLRLLRNLQTDDDINSSRELFSYKHFYVIYCKFWELDSDHDMQISPSELLGYDSHTLTPLAARRVTEGCGRPMEKSGCIGYKDFVWFVLCVEDKRRVGSIEYW
ncbi:Serine/threonine-protein phosphatase 2A regulatory subunit B'' subunit beta [Entophlyctis luteolus]|nr:Serine/threonine-protein phosphatase 2A regulatory subunit B'' subunit beta [Entophlyctis luteolus]